MGSLSRIREHAEIVVIGGGAVGVCCAVECASRGHDVVLLERDDICAGSSYGNAAFIPPSRSLPLAGPGVIAKSLRWMFEPRGTFRLRPRVDAELARWLWVFKRSCTTEDALSAALVIRDLTRESLGIYERLAKEDLDFGFHKSGLLELFRTPEGELAAQAEMRRLDEIVVSASLVGVEEVRRRVPHVHESVTGGLLASEDAHINPPLFVRAMASRARDRGAVIETQTDVTGFVTSGSSIAAITTNRGTIKADTVVLANGAWAGRVGRQLGLRLLIEPAKGYSFAIETDEVQVAQPLLLNEIRTTVTPFPGALRVTAKLDLVGFDRSIRGSRVNAIPTSINEYLNVPAEPRVLESWCGFRPLTPDGLPLIGRPRAYTNLVLAVGGGRMGLALAPLMGRLIGQLADADPYDDSLPHFDPDRFSTVRQ